MKTITHEEVLQIARLARLELEPDLVASYAGQIGKILEYIQILQTVEVPTTQAPALNSETHMPRLDDESLLEPQGLRPDIARGAPNVFESMVGIPEREGNYFAVPRIIES